jgi:hypothetical protein
MVRAELAERWAAIADECAHVMVSPRSDLVAVAARFSAEDAHEVAQRLRDEGAARGFAWPETREGLIAFAQEHGRRYFEQHGGWPSTRSGAMWSTLRIQLRACGVRMCELFNRSSPGNTNWHERLDAIVAWHNNNGRPPCYSKSAPEQERALARWLATLRRMMPQAVEAAGLAVNVSNLDVARLRRRTWPQPKRLPKSVPSLLQSGVGVHVLALCAFWPVRRHDVTPAFTGEKLSHAIRNAARLGLVDLAQTTSLPQLNNEIAADCWRLWLDGADQPDPRPWADILAAGDNKRVVKAERVAFLDWTDLDRAGKPKRKPWSPPAANGLAGDLAAAE